MTNYFILYICTSNAAAEIIKTTNCGGISTSLMSLFYSYFLCNFLLSLQKLKYTKFYVSYDNSLKFFFFLLLINFLIVFNITCFAAVKYLALAMTSDEVTKALNAHSTAFSKNLKFVDRKVYVEFFYIFKIKI